MTAKPPWQVAPRVVTITPNAIGADSRSFKFAASAARLGFESVVVEGKRTGGPSEGLPFRLLSCASEPAAGSTAVSAEAPLVSLADWARGLPAPLGAPIRALALGLHAVSGPLRNSLFILRAHLRDYLGLNRATYRLLPDAQVYWVHHYRQIPAGWVKARRARARFLYDAPDAYWEPGHFTAQNRTMRVILRGHEAIERAGARRAERFTTVSAGLVDLFDRRFGRRPEVIRNCHDTRMEEPVAEDLRSAIGIGREEFLLAMPGSLISSSAVRGALNALEALPGSVHMAFIGPHDAVPRQVVDEIRGADRAHLLEPVPPAQVVSFIRGADASPILYEADSMSYLYSLPNRFFHAVGAGLPILYPPLSEIRTLAVEHELGIEIDPAVPASIKSAVRRLIEDPALAERYRENVAEASRALNWEHEEAVIRDILGSRG